MIAHWVWPGGFQNRLEPHLIYQIPAYSDNRSQSSRPALPARFLLKIISGLSQIMMALEKTHTMGWRCYEIKAYSHSQVGDKERFLPLLWRVPWSCCWTSLEILELYWMPPQIEQNISGLRANRYWSESFLWIAVAIGWSGIKGLF